MSIPYMGSKAKIADLIYNKILDYNQQKPLLIDLFCGGFAISEIFLKKGWKVIANDKNFHVIELLKKVIYDGLPEEIVTKFVTREMFIDIQNKPENYEAWHVGYVQCCWSFGNNQRNYLFGKDVEQIKHAGHELVINKNVLKIISDLIPAELIDNVLKNKTRIKRRMALKQVSVILKNRKLELQQLEQLERLQQLEQLELYSKNYNEIKIPDCSIIYCDPPYKNTATYKENWFNHAEFWEWCRDISKTNKIYISEYNAPDDFIPVLDVIRKSTLQGGTQKHKNQPTEKLFIPINQIELFGQQKLF